MLAAGLALIVMDGPIVDAALPTMIGALDLSLTNAQWVNAIYNVIFAALLLGAGRLGDRIGRRTTFAAGVILFVGGSLLAAVSSGPSSLIGARAVQGVGGALALPATLSTVNSLFTGKDRAAAFGVWGAVMSGTAALGPLLGGVLTKYCSWRWIFWVNLPLGPAGAARHCGLGAGDLRQAGHARRGRGRRAHLRDRLRPGGVRPDRGRHLGLVGEAGHAADRLLVLA